MGPKFILSDSQLIDAFRRGDEDAFESLVKRHERMVFNVCLRCLGDEHAAEDACQAVFLLLAHKGPDLQFRDKLPSWLCRVAWNVAVRNRFSQKQRQKREMVVSSRSLPVMQFEAEEVDVAQELHRELNELPERFRDPLLVHYLEGHSAMESARILGLELGVFLSRIRRARDILRKRLVRKGAAASAMVMGALLVSQAVKAAELPAGFALSTAKAAGAIAAGKSTSGLVSGRVHSFIKNSSPMTKAPAFLNAPAFVWGAAAALIAIGLAPFLYYFYFSSALPQSFPLSSGDVGSAHRIASEPLNVEANVDLKLAQPINVKWLRAMPVEVLADLRAATEINFVLPNLHDVKRGLELVDDNITPREVLNRLCHDYELEFEVRGDTVVVWQKLDEVRLNELARASRIGEPNSRADAAYNLARSNSLRALPELVACLSDPDEIVNYWAVTGLQRNSGCLLGFAEKSEEAASALLVLLKHTPASLTSSRAALLTLLAQTRSTAALQTFAEPWPESAEERRLLADALESCPLPIANEFLGRLLQDSDQQVRAAAANSMATAFGTSLDTAALLKSLADDSDLVRAAAARALARSKQIGVSDAVRSLLSDPSARVRAAAASTLGLRMDRPSTAALKSFTSDSSRDVRVAAANALMRLGEKDDVALLMKVIFEFGNDYSWSASRQRFESDNEVVWMWRRRLQRNMRTTVLDLSLASKERLADALFAELNLKMSANGLSPRYVGSMGYSRDPRIYDALAELTTDARREIRSAARRSLFIGRDSRALNVFAADDFDEISFHHIDEQRTVDLLERMIRLAEVSSPQLRAVVAGEIGLFEHPSASRFLFNSARSAEGLTASPIAWSLSPDRVSFLLDLIEVDGPVDALAQRNRTQAIGLLEQIADPRVEPRLVKGLKDADPLRRAAFASAMKNVVNKEVVLVLADMARNDSQQDVRLAALRALNNDRTNTPAALSAIFDALEEAEEVARAGDKISALEKCVDGRNPDALEKARAAAIERLAQVSSAVPLLEKLAQDESALARRAALNALIILNAPRKLSLLEPLLKDKDPFVRIGALGMLAGGDASEELRLLNAALDDPHPEVRRVAAAIIDEAGVMFAATTAEQSRKPESVINEAQPQKPVLAPPPSDGEF